MRVPRPIRSLLLVVLTLLLGAVPARAALETFPLPAGATVGGGLSMHGLVVAPDGIVWFTAQGNPAGDSTPLIGRFDPSTGQFSTYRTPEHPRGAGNTAVTSLAWDTVNSRLWFARNDGVYGYANPSALNAGTIGAGMNIATTTTAGKYSVEGLAVDQTNGTVWMAERDAGSAAIPSGSSYFPGNRLAKTSLGLGLTDLPNLAQQGGEPSLVSLRYDAKPTGVSLDSSGNAWFGEADPGNPGWRIGRASGSAYTEWSLPCQPSGSPCSGSYTFGPNGAGGPDSTAIASDGSVWFTIPLNNQIGRLDPSSNTITTYRLADMGAALAAGRPRGIKSAPDGSLWFAVYGGLYSSTGANAIVKIVPTGTSPSSTVFSTGPDAVPFAVAPAPNGDIYATLGTKVAPTLLGRLSAGAGPAPTPTPAPGSTPTPAPGSTPAPGATPTPVPAPTPTAKPLGPGMSTSVAPGDWKVTPDGVAARQICVGPPNDKCSLVFLLDTQEYVTGFPGSRNAVAAAAPKTKKRTELGKLSLTLKTGQKKTVSVKLSAKAKRALKKQKRLKVRLTVTQKFPDGTKKVLETRNFTLKG